MVLNSLDPGTIQAVELQSKSEKVLTAILYWNYSVAFILIVVYPIFYFLLLSPSPLT